MRRTSFLVLSTVMACGGHGPQADLDGSFAIDATADAGPSPSDSGADAGRPADASGVDPCAVVPEAPPTSSAGGRAFLALEEATSATVAWPETWRGLPPAEGALRARIPADAEGVYTATVTIPNCPPEALRLDVRAPRWAEIAEWASPDGPDAREHPAIFMDPRDENRLILHGGVGFFPSRSARTDTWALDLDSGGWSRLAVDGEAALPIGRYVSDQATGALLYEGGTDLQTMLPYALRRLTVTATVAVWESVDVSSPLGGSPVLHALMPDPRGSGFLSVFGLIGLQTFSTGVYAVDVDDGSMSLLEIVGSPPSPRYGFAFAADTEGERLVVSTGGQNPTFSDPVNGARDTWALELDGDGLTWTELAGDGVAPRRNGCHAFDPEGRRLFLYGGTADGFTAVEGLWVLELDEGEERWLELDLPGAPPPRASCTAVYDPKRKQILLGFGNTTTAVYADLYALELEPQGM